MRLMLLLSCSTAIGCTVGTSLPFGGRTTPDCGPSPSSGAVAVNSSESAVADGDDAPAAPAGRIPCVRDSAGSAFSSAAPLAKGLARGCLDTSKTDVYA